MIILSRKTVEGSQKSPVSEPLLAAAELCRLRALEIIDSLENGDDNLPKPLANDGFSMDDLFLDLTNRTRNPKVSFKSEDRNNPNWTHEYLIDAYRGVGLAFTKAGLIIGGNIPGQKEALEERSKELNNILDSLRVLGIDKKSANGTFAARTTLLFKHDPLPNRRPERVGTIQRLGESLEQANPNLIQLIKWLDKDIKSLSKYTNGRPRGLEKRAYVEGLGVLWTDLTGTAPSSKVDSVFGRLVIETWNACRPNEPKDTNFARALRPSKG